MTSLGLTVYPIPVMRHVERAVAQCSAKGHEPGNGERHDFICDGCAKDLVADDVERTRHDMRRLFSVLVLRMLPNNETRRDLLAAVEGLK